MVAIRLRSVLPALLTLLSTVSASAVIDLDTSNFDKTILKSGKPALVEFFAPWCGHCKNLAPVYDELAQNFAYASDKVIIAKVDADAHKDLGRKYGVQGFPTLKWFDGKHENPAEYSGGRDLESLSSWITDKTGIKPKAKKGKPSVVTMLDDKSFKERVGADQHVLVAFTAPWCGHCKSLAPIWETLAEDFAPEPTVLIAKVDAEATQSKATAEEQGVKSYPTIKFFPKGSTTPIEYRGGRTEKDFVDFLNEQAGTHRAVGGGLDATGGTIAALDTIIKRIVKSADFTAGLDEVKSAAEGVKDKYAQYYVKVVQKLGKNKDYAQKELNRLEGMLKKGGVAPEKKDDLTSRSNVLKRFLADENEEKSEL